MEMPGFQVWQSPGGLVWEGIDQEDAVLAGLRHRRTGVVVEVAEIYNAFGELRPRRVAHYDGHQKAERAE